MTDRDFDYIVNKLGFEVRQGNHVYAKLYHDGKLVAHTKRSNKRGELPAQRQIRQQLGITETQVREIRR